MIRLSRNKSLKTLQLRVHWLSSDSHDRTRKNCLRDSYYQIHKTMMSTCYKFVFIFINNEGMTIIFELYLLKRNVFNMLTFILYPYLIFLL